MFSLEDTLKRCSSRRLVGRSRLSLASVSVMIKLKGGVLRLLFCLLSLLSPLKGVNDFVNEPENFKKMTSEAQDAARTPCVFGGLGAYLEATVTYFRS